MDISLSSKTADEVQRLVGNRHVTAVVGTINPHLESYPFIALTDFLFGDGIARLRTLLGATLIDPTLLNPSATQREAAYNTPAAQNALVFTRRADLMREISFTLSQAIYLRETTGLVPKWLPPSQMFWALTTTIAFGLAAISILSGYKALLASRLAAGAPAAFGTLPAHCDFTALTARIFQR